MNRAHGIDSPGLAWLKNPLKKTEVRTRKGLMIFFFFFKNCDCCLQITWFYTNKIVTMQLENYQIHWWVLVKFQDTKLSHRNLLHFYPLTTKKSEREIKETIPFTLTSKRKYPGINLPREGKDLYSENYKTLMEETEEDTNMERYTMFLNWKNHYHQNDCTIQGNLQIQST